MNIVTAVDEVTQPGARVRAFEVREHRDPQSAFRANPLDAHA